MYVAAASAAPVYPPAEPRASSAGCSTVAGGVPGAGLRQGSTVSRVSRRRSSRRAVEVARSEEHTSELQSQFHLVCRLLLEKKNKTITNHQNDHIKPYILAYTTKYSM